MSRVLTKPETIATATATKPEVAAALLQRFCSLDKVGMTTPFSIGAYTYATNGHVLVRVDRLADVPENAASPNPEGCIRFNFSQRKTGWTPVVEVLADPNKRNGDKVRIGGAFYRASYLELVAKLPGAETIRARDDYSPASFRFDGGIGMICRRRRKEEMELR